MTTTRALGKFLVPLMLATACVGDAPSPTMPLDPDLSNSRRSGITLQVTKAGTGAGRVTSDPSGIDCGSTCTSTFSKKTVVTLTATAFPGSVFAGWSGEGCSGTGTCTVTMSASRAVTATFNNDESGGATGPFTLAVNKVHTGNGTGSVRSSPEGISCDPTCFASYPAGTTVTLTAEASTGRFAGWSGGGCSGTQVTCTVTLNANTTVTATFETTPLTITTNELPDGHVGAEYSAFITSSGGFGSRDIYTIISGSLPRGLTMDESFGVQSTLIHGIPREEGTSTFTVQVEDQSGTATKTFTITILGPEPVVITLPGETSKPATVGTFYFQNLFADGGAPPYDWSVSAGQLPPGLELVSASNGNRIEGTPTTAGTYTFTLTVTDDLGQTASQQTSITVSAP